MFCISKKKYFSQAWFNVCQSYFLNWANPLCLSIFICLVTKQSPVDLTVNWNVAKNIKVKSLPATFSNKIM